MDGRLALLGLPALAGPGLLFVLASWLPRHTDVLGSLGAAIVMVAATVYLCLRPTQITVTDRHVTIDFPTRSVELARRDIRAVEIYDLAGFQTRFGGGSWFRLAPLVGGLGWLPTATETFEAYLSNAETVVVLILRHRRPVLVTPANPTRFVAMVQPAVAEPAMALAVSTTR
jgi:hypothetical protein